MKPEKNNRIVCIIPARYGSTRLPGKPLIKIKGLPLVMWTYNRAVESDAFNDVYIATDNRRIEDAVMQCNGKSIMTSSSHTSGTDRIFEAIRSIDCTYVVNLQGDEPQIPISILKEFAENIEKIDNSSLLTCVSNATIEDIHNPDVVKVVLAENGDALYFSRAPIPFAKNGLPCKRYKHTGIYGFTRESLNRFCSHPPGMLENTENLEQLRALEMGMKIHCIIRNYDSVSIDTQDDLDAFKSNIGDMDS